MREYSKDEIVQVIKHWADDYTKTPRCIVEQLEFHKILYPDLTPKQINKAYHFLVSSVFLEAASMIVDTEEETV